MRSFFIFVFLFISSTFSFCSNNCFFYELFVKITGDSPFLLYTRTWVDLGVRLTSSGQIVKNKLCLPEWVGLSTNTALASGLEECRWSLRSVLWPTDKGDRRLTAWVLWANKKQNLLLENKTLEQTCQITHFLKPLISAKWLLSVYKFQSR